jgi:hypothetical protein
MARCGRTAIMEIDAPMKVMVIGFPKSGTTSITEALRASGLRAAHWRLPSGRFVGQAIYGAVAMGRDPFFHLKKFDAVTQADVCLPEQKLCLWPNLDFAVLRAIRRAHPECLFLLNYRQPDAICDSIAKWADLGWRLRVSNIPGLPKGLGGKREHLMSWIENHYDACRTYFANDEKFLELDIEAADVPEKLGKALGMEIIGWGDHKPAPNPVATAKLLASPARRRSVVRAR